MAPLRLEWQTHKTTHFQFIGLSPLSHSIWLKKVNTMQTAYLIQNTKFEKKIVRKTGNCCLSVKGMIVLQSICL